MGPIRVADFNGNGQVTQDDYTMAHAAIQFAIDNPSSVPICVFATGDINDDGTINAMDYAEFELYWVQPNAIRNYFEANEL